MMFRDLGGKVMVECQRIKRDVAHTEGSYGEQNGHGRTKADGLEGMIEEGYGKENAEGHTGGEGGNIAIVCAETGRQRMARCGAHNFQLSLVRLRLDVLCTHFD